MKNPTIEETTTAAQGDEPTAASTRINPERPRLGTIGIAGGGQLAQMLAHAASKIGLRTVVLDPDARCSAAKHADQLIVAGFDTYEGLDRLAQASEAITFEIERVDAAALRKLEETNVPVNPSARVLATIQDKLEQKQFLQSLGIPTSAFAPFEAVDQPACELPFVWKARRGGYDGRGVAVVRARADLATLPSVPGLIEELVDIVCEFAIIVARDVNGSTECYPLTEIQMDPDAHVLDTVIAPARADEAVVDTCRTYACEIAQALDYVGVLAVEFFLGRDGNIQVNELSPRPHNSGHYSIEACTTSQFEQHLRAVAGLTLGATDLNTAAATFNLLGPVEPAMVARLAERGVLGAGVHVHDYEKAEIRDGRKMGHVTVTAATAEEALDRVRRVKQAIAERLGMST